MIQEFDFVVQHAKGADNFYFRGSFLLTQSNSVSLTTMRLGRTYDSDSRAFTSENREPVGFEIHSRLAKRALTGQTSESM